ncbi:hypothetical protein D1872_293330 [compost metagenome]
MGHPLHAAPRAMHDYTFALDPDVMDPKELAVRISVVCRNWRRASGLFDAESGVRISTFPLLSVFYRPFGNHSGSALHDMGRRVPPDLEIDRQNDGFP